MDDSIWISIGLGLLGSGGIVAWARTRAEMPKLAAEAQSTVIRDITAENDRLKELIETERAERKEEQAVSKARINGLQAQVSALRERIAALEKE